MKHDDAAKRMIQHIRAIATLSTLGIDTNALTVAVPTDKDGVPIQCAGAATTTAAARTTRTTTRRTTRARTTTTAAAATTSTTPAAAETTSAAAATTATPATTTTPTTTATPTTSQAATTSSVATTTSAVVAVTNTTSSSSATSPSSVTSASSASSGLSSSSNVSGTNEAASASASSKHSHSNGGTIAGAVIGVLAALLIALGIFFFFRRKRRAQRGLFGGSSSGEKEDDHQSLFGQTAMAGDAAAMNEKGNQQYGMTSMTPYDGYNDNATQAWQGNNLSSYPSSGAAAAAPVVYQNNQPFGQQPESPYDPAPYGAPVAAMMHAPNNSNRMPANNPYTAAMPVAAPIVEVTEAPTEGEQQEGPFADPEWEGKLFSVVRTFTPSQPDELIIMPGDRLQILIKYDDDWCLGYNLDRVQPVHPGEQVPKGPKSGVFPYNCVEEIQTGGPSETLAGQDAKGGATQLHRVPTLPPIDVSQSFSDSPVFAMVQEDSNPVPKSDSAKHLSSGSSLTHEMSLIDKFAAPPASMPTKHLSTDATPRAPTAKRTSSLIASKDADLFAQLSLDDGKQSS